MAKRRKSARFLPEVRRLVGFYFRHALLWCLLVFAGYWIWLDFTVAEQFANGRWSVPTRIYASPLELYVGLSVSNDLIESTLKQLSYEKKSRATRPGSYALSEHGIEIFTRGHLFPESPSKPTKLRLAISDERISKLLAGENGDEALIQRLEPLEIGSVHATKFEDRVIVSGTDIPITFVKALVATEDRRFFNHFGIDLLGVSRAMIQNIRAGSVKQGASTITQQLVKNQFLSNERSYTRKVREALMAMSLERRYSKSVILNTYINEVFLGQDGNRAIHGFGLGARFIFGKRLTELSIAETALLIGMVKAPSSYNPRRNPQAALARRNVVLKVLLGRDVIDRAQYDAAIASPLRVADTNSSGAINFAAFVDLVQKQLVRDYGDTYLQQAGLDVYTSLDPMVHGIAARAMEQRLTAIDKARGLEHGELQTAMVIADPRTGEVISLIGGRDSHQGNFNRALNAHRPIGSLVKPFIYLTALEQQSRFNVVSTINDAAVSVPLQSGEVWAPKNYDNKLHGQVSLLSAFTNSYNLATVNLGLSLGLKNVIRRLQELGIEREFDHVPSVLLGALSLTPFEVTQLYQGIANDGFRVPLRVIRSVANDKNEVLQRFSPSVEQITTPANAVVTQYLMSQVVENGTGRSARPELRDKLPLAGKTGTSNDERDSWFAGFSRNFLAVIWVGHDDNTETGLTGSSGALKLWSGLMKKLDVLPIVFSNVEGLQWHRVNSSGSAIVPDHCADLLYVPLALPHGLPVLSICDGDDVPEPEGALWRKLRGWFR